MQIPVMHANGEALEDLQLFDHVGRQVELHWAPEDRRNADFTTTTYPAAVARLAEAAVNTDLHPSLGRSFGQREGRIPRRAF